MRKCELCHLEFESFQAKANHVRWQHKEKKYSDEGYEKIRQVWKDVVIKRLGEKTFVTETRVCECGTSFEVTFSPERKCVVRKTCSKLCAARRKQTPEMNEKKSRSVKATFAKNPECYMKGIRAASNSKRFSSKAERALAEKLAPLGFKRHHHVKVDGKIFDVDITSKDERIWIESDGEWHFKQVHSGHDFEATKARDLLEEQEAVKRNILLLRVNNQTTSIEQQIDFIMNSITEWNGVGVVLKLGMLLLNT